MYALIWRLLPGPLPIRVGLAAALLAAAVLLLFTVVFPRVESWTGQLLPFADVTVTDDRPDERPDE